MKIIEYIKGIIALIVGHLTVLKYAFKKRVTLEYPERKKVLNDRFRGQLEVNIKKCLGCQMCQKVCPCVGVLNIEKVENSDKKKVVKSFTIDTAQCIFCGNCVVTCPAKALSMNTNYELAAYNLHSLEVYTRNKGVI